MRVAQLDRALGYGPRCRGFESSHARQPMKGLRRLCFLRPFVVFLFFSPYPDHHDEAESCDGAEEEKGLSDRSVGARGTAARRADPGGGHLRKTRRLGCGKRNGQNEI